ncbi:MAG: hypothetical protein H0W50_11940 [Parachlamydiaceae bacterium]|nr:hypothetical protein [Parachlamydiaceae bacterium]
MTFKSTIEELSDLGERFNTWKTNNPRRHVPKQYWNDALQCAAKYGVNEVAQAIKCHPSLIAHKQRKKESALDSDVEFVKMLPCQSINDSQLIQVNIQNHQGVAVAVAFHGDIKQLFPLITGLLREENRCSK